VAGRIGDTVTASTFLPFLEGLRLSGDVRADMAVLLVHHGYPKTVEHCVRVAEQARRLATRFGQNEGQAEIAGWLHDASTIVPLAQRVALARQCGLAVVSEEVAAPMLLHQKLSAALAREVFRITDAAILSAIECHTTLKAGASQLDKTVFIADKIAWDGAGDPPYLRNVMAGLAESLDRAVVCYLEYLWQRRDILPAVHPWFVAAYQQLRIVD
jgi:predicted HD superfamily hydrolase involved in NAD metabolism